MSFNLATILSETAAAAPDSPACRIGGITVTYRELDEQSGRLAAGRRPREPMRPPLHRAAKSLGL
jgi:acyl-CoA synthetase (AMP-forming)/AMP-acid ligase II